MSGVFLVQYLFEPVETSNTVFEACLGPDVGLQLRKLTLALEYGRSIPEYQDSHNRGMLGYDIRVNISFPSLVFQALNILPIEVLPTHVPGLEPGFKRKKLESQNTYARYTGLKDDSIQV